MDRLLDLDSDRTFIGKQALLDIRKAGITRRIVGMEISAPPLQQGLFTEPWPATRNRHIGEALVALHSPRLDKNIGYAMLGAEHASLGTRFKVGSPLGELNAEVVEMPFVKPVKA
jgi:aminomethyltransferase